jgi:hypothetical protein
MNADGLDQAFDNLGKAIKITAGLKGTDKSITEVFKMSGIDEKLEEILWDLLRMDWHINHMAEDLNEKDTADDRQTNVEEAIKELESLIAQQVKEAKINELEGVKKALFIEGAIDRRLATLKGDDK